MRVFSRLVMILGVPAALAVGFSLMPSAWIGGRGWGGWNFSDLRRQLVEAYQRRAEMQYQIEIANRRTESRRRVLHEVLAGRETLLGAAASLRAIDTTPADFQLEHPKFFPGSSEDERLCREVIVRVTNEVKAKDPDHAASWRARLEAELQEHLRTHNGVVALPRE
jgi:hypothetical protein